MMCTLDALAGALLLSFSYRRPFCPFSLFVLSLLRHASERMDTNEDVKLG
jgi:hypothetical protein